MRKLARAAACAMFAALINPCIYAQNSSRPGVFYVSSYSASGTHTDYDMARQAADAYDAASTWSTGSVLILKAGQNFTCDAVPLPSLGNPSTTSIIGSGSATTSIVKSPACAASTATLLHGDSPNGVLSRGVYQGFTVDANHIDAAACDMYGMSLTTFIDVSCGNAAANADHELEFGNRDANLAGWMDNIYIYGLKTFDSVSGGTGAVLQPVWNGSALGAVQVVNGGTSAYTGLYTRAQIFGPDLNTCTSIPTITPILNGSHKITGALVNNAGKCSSTTHLSIIVQDGTPATYGIKFSNMADSHAWKLQAIGATTYGIGWMQGSNNNSSYLEEPTGDEVYGIYDNANGNRHISPVFKNYAGYAADIWAQNGTLQSPVLAWSDNSALSASGYLLGNDRHVYQDWMIQSSTCAGTASSNFLPIVTQRGVLTSTNPVPAGAKPQTIEVCDGTDAVDWQMIQ